MEGDKIYPYQNATVHSKYYAQTTSKPDKQESHVGRYPTTFRTWPVRRDGTGISRTDDQIDYFIQTYSNPGHLVLDMTCHNKTVGNRCKALDRNYIGVDIHPINTA